MHGSGDLGEEDLELRGVRAQAMQFAGGSRDPASAVVCIAGMGADGRSFLRQRPLARDRWLLLLNLPFDTPGRRDPLAFSTEIVEEFIAHERLQRPVLLGASFGGAVAVRVALRDPHRLSALILAGAVLSHRSAPLASTTFVDLLEAPDPLARLLAPLAAQIMGGFALDRRARDELVSEARHFSGRELKRRVEALKHLDLGPELGALHVPVLWLHGGRDLLVPWRRARRMARRFPDARFQLVRRAGHVPYLSHPAEFNAAAARFLASI